jgi:hypothetical protein
MKASQVSEAQKAFILKQGREGMPVAEICLKVEFRGSCDVPQPDGWDTAGRDLIEAGLN